MQRSSCVSLGLTSTTCKSTAKQMSDLHEINLMDSVMGPRIAQIWVVLVIHHPKIALPWWMTWRCSLSALKNTFLFLKPDCRHRPGCRLWALQVSLITLMPFSPCSFFFGCCSCSQMWMSDWSDLGVFRPGTICMSSFTNIYSCSGSRCV